MKLETGLAAFFYVVLVIGALDPLTGSGRAMAWAVGGLVVPLVALPVAFRAQEPARWWVVGVSLFVGAFLVFNGTAVA